MSFEEQNKELSNEELEKVVGGMETGSEMEPCVKCGKYYPTIKLTRGLCFNCRIDEN